MAQFTGLDHRKLQNGGIIALVAGVAGIVLLVFDTGPTTTEGAAVAAVLLVVCPILALIGIVMLILAWLTDTRQESEIEVSELEVRTREIMASDGLTWHRAWKQAEVEGADPATPARHEPDERDPDSPSSDIEDRLRELKRLYDDGLIDVDEYRRKQRSLLEGF